jgi:hypothetical protein
MLRRSGMASRSAKALDESTPNYVGESNTAAVIFPWSLAVMIPVTGVFFDPSSWSLEEERILHF